MKEWTMPGIEVIDMQDTEAANFARLSTLLGINNWSQLGNGVGGNTDSASGQASPIREL